METEPQIWRDVALYAFGLISTLLIIMDRRRSKQITDIFTHLTTVVSRDELNSTVKSVRDEINKQGESSARQWQDVATRIENQTKATQEIYGELLKISQKG